MTYTEAKQIRDELEAEVNITKLAHTRALRHLRAYKPAFEQAYKAMIRAEREAKPDKPSDK